MSKSFIEHLHYVRIPVRDLEQSAQWYKDVLGLELLTITEDPFAIFKMNDGPFLITLVPADEDTFVHFTIGNEAAFILGFAVPELEAFHQHLINHGVKVEDMQEDKGHAFFNFYDPNGNKLQSHW
ncbi:VOC family protein [Jeotgalibacillus terrae]|uniref:VOC family protein n=1 Tax=Jeotgalibacillus terrae TaxID=587735 RepID=A0ABW5ZKT8_9BACL|nr:VOC family protein [Jeotgalibacillus terrae]MBM7578160.1 catechol 2,3-dioxygenase-like lactoylglutathione lyase family enzyme [Jeotgalibacillus terrae]